MRSTTLNFINELRTVGIRISLSESMDAVQAVAATGIEREVLRESLATCVVKEEEDSFAFDEVFERFFAGPTRKDKKKPLPHSREGIGQRTTKTTQSEHARPSERPQKESEKKLFSPQSVQPQESKSDQKDEKARLAKRKALLHKSLSLFDSRDVEEAKELVEDLSHRFRGHLTRRQRRTKRGRRDFRRTIRVSISHGGALVDLRIRGRRLGKPDLVALCDLSGSVSTVSDFLLALLAPANYYFRHERTFAYVDRLCEVSFEQGYVISHDDLDLYARSDFGQVLQNFWQTEGKRALTRNTIVLILGGARNNRRPPRADLLSQIRDNAKKLIWLNPEPRERWVTGDSVINRYTPMYDAVLGCEDLKEVLGALKQVF